MCPVAPLDESEKRSMSAKMLTRPGSLHIRLCTLLCAAVWACFAARPAPLEAGVHKVTVFTSGTEGYHTFRIPAILRAANGDLLAWAEGRKNSSSDSGDIDLVMKRSRDNGQTWGPLELVQDEWANPTANVTIGNPAPVVDRLDPLRPGRIWLPFSRNNDRVFVTYSDDHGATWSPRREVTSTTKDPSWGWYATGPVHGIQLTRGDHAGRLIIPSDHRISGVSSWGSHVVYSDDHGQNWQLGAVDTHLGSDDIHPNENVAVELVDGRIYFNARDQNGSSPATRAVAFSSDGGVNYDAPFIGEPDITSPVVQNSAVRFAATDEGDPQNILLHSAPGQANSRQDMTIRVSLDEGTSWTMETLIHPGPSAYSDLVKLNAETVGILYEAGDALYEEIVFGYFAFADLEPQPWNGIEGDVNQDGVFDTADLEAFVEAWTPVTNEFYLGGVDSYTNDDLNFDGKNDLFDVFLMRQATLAAGLDAGVLETLSIPEPGARELMLLISTGACFLGMRP